MSPESDSSPIPTGEIQLLGRILPASNATWAGEVDGVRVVYKPVAGERPLWDFPDGTLAGREVSAYLVSEATGWDIVPPTELREDGPHGPGMVQLWKDVDDSRPVDLVGRGRVPGGWLAVFEGYDERDRRVTLVHEDTEPLRHMAVFDVLINNGDRKGGHVLPMPGGHRHGVDHGVSMSAEPKLRTVLWGWLGEPLTDAEREVVARVGSDQDLLDALGFHVALWEVDAFVARCERLLVEGVLPSPGGGWPPIPWPPF